MHSFLSRTGVIVGLVLFLWGGMSWGQAPPNNDVSDADGNTAGGTGALISNTTGIHNTAWGFEALQNNSSGDSNTAVGFTAMGFNLSGFYNTASGFRALRLNLDGHHNTASGAYALYTNDTGSYNTANGYQALWSNATGHYNTASGGAALLNNTTGSNNTASGYQALHRTSSGTSNTALGYKALWHNSVASRNLALGYQAGFQLMIGSNNVYLAHTGQANESNTMRLGQDQTRAFLAGVTGVPVSGSAVLITSSGQLGIQASSARYKRDIQPMGTRSQGLHQLRPVTFRYKQDRQGQRQYGLIAEDVAKVYPELVTRNAAGNVEAVQYHAVVPLVLNEVQQQQAIAVQAQQLEELRAQNARLQALVVQLQKREEEQQVQHATLVERLEQLEAAARVVTFARR